MGMGSFWHMSPESSERGGGVRGHWDRTGWVALGWLLWTSRDSLNATHWKVTSWFPNPFPICSFSWNAQWDCGRGCFAPYFASEEKEVRIFLGYSAGWGLRICVFTRMPGNSYVQITLRNTMLRVLSDMEGSHRGWQMKQETINSTMALSYIFHHHCSISTSTL